MNTNLTNISRLRGRKLGHWLHLIVTSESNGAMRRSRHIISRSKEAQSATHTKPQKRHFPQIIQKGNRTWLRSEVKLYKGVLLSVHAGRADRTAGHSNVTPDERYQSLGGLEAEFRSDQ